MFLATATKPGMAMTNSIPMATQISSRTQTNTAIAATAMFITEARYPAGLRSVTGVTVVSGIQVAKLEDSTTCKPKSESKYLSLTQGTGAQGWVTIVRTRTAG